MLITKNTLFISLLLSACSMSAQALNLDLDKIMANKGQASGAITSQGDYDGLTLGYYHPIDSHSYAEIEYVSLSASNNLFAENVDVDYHEFTVVYGQTGTLNSDVDYFWQAGLSFNGTDVSYQGNNANNDDSKFAFELGISKQFNNKISAKAFIGSNDDSYIGGIATYKFNANVSAFIDIKTMQSDRLTVGATYQF